MHEKCEADNIIALLELRRMDFFLFYDNNQV